MLYLLKLLSWQNLHWHILESLSKKQRHTANLTKWSWSLGMVVGVIMGLIIVIIAPGIISAIASSEGLIATIATC